MHYPTSGYIVKGNEIIASERDLYSHVHCSIIHSSLGIETTIFHQVNGLKQCDVTYIGKYYLAIRKRKKSSHLCNMDETGGHYAKWTKSEKDKYHRISTIRNFQKKKELRVEK